MRLRTAKMLQLIAVVIDRDADAATKELLRQGVLHLVNVREVEQGWQRKVRQMEPQVSLARIGEMRNRIESLLDMTGSGNAGPGELDLERLAPLDLDGVEKSLDDLASQVHAYREKQRELQQEIMRLEDIRRQVALFGDLPSAIRSGSAHSFLDIRAGLVTADREQALRTALRPLPSVLSPSSLRTLRSSGKTGPWSGGPASWCPSAGTRRRSSASSPATGGRTPSCRARGWPRTGTCSAT